MVGGNHTLTHKGCDRAMNTTMSQKTRPEVLARKRDRYARAGKEHKTKIINELVELFDYHRKAAIRALQARPVVAPPWSSGGSVSMTRTNCAPRSKPSGWRRFNPAAFARLAAGLRG